MRAEMVYYQQVGLRQYWLSQCYKASGVNHYEDCREDAVELLRYLTYWNGVNCCYHSTIHTLCYICKNFD